MCCNLLIVSDLGYCCKDLAIRNFCLESSNYTGKGIYIRKYRRCMQRLSIH